MGIGGGGGGFSGGGFYGGSSSDDPITSCWSCWATIFGVFLTLLIVAIIHPSYILCSSASTSLFSGEQNLCIVPGNQNKTTIQVPLDKALNFSHYVFDSNPNVTSTRFFKTFSDFGHGIAKDYWLYYAFALPKSSKINFTVWSDEENTEWYFSREYGSKFKTIVRKDKNYIWAGFGGQTQKFSFTVDESRTYYLTCYVTTKSKKRMASTNWLVDVDYATYDVSNAKQVCQGKAKCSLNNTAGKFIVSSLNKGAVMTDPDVPDLIYFGKTRMTGTFGIVLYSILTGIFFFPFFFWTIVLIAHFVALCSCCCEGGCCTCCCRDSCCDCCCCCGRDDYSYRSLNDDTPDSSLFPGFTPGKSSSVNDNANNGDYSYGTPNPTPSDSDATDQPPTYPSGV